MSRTTRVNRRDKYRRKSGEGRFYAYVDPTCKHNNSCSWCVGNRTHANKRRAPIVELN